MRPVRGAGTRGHRVVFRIGETSMDVTIYHNPKCSTSRKVLDMIRARKIAPKIVLYLDNPPSKTTLKALLKAMGLSPRELLRKRGSPYEELGLDDERLSNDAIIALMSEHPALIERPIVQTPRGTRLCRPPERVLEIL